MQETAYTNNLIHEVSPYLQQHAHNPVDWYPWGPEALAKAKAEDKPIFLSVGYSACHWCHVMAHESFENPDIAAVMNQHFINIKVDREERPDLDQIYQTICQLVTHHGGWPLSVWLTPDQRPFYVGTYYPPDERYGRPGFKQVLLAVSRAYREKRAEVTEMAGEWANAIALSDEIPENPSGAAGKELLVKAGSALVQHVDRTNGGFGGAPKFPNPTSLDLMLRSWRSTREAAYYVDLVALTLRAMARGGIYDQLGGGFHRYSVDATWSVPHFEKMLYDNAALPPVYLAAWQVTGEPLFRRVAEETLWYVMREMTHPEGGFYSSTDADSEGEEGKYFVWNPAEVRAAVGPELADLLCRHFGVTEAGNFEQTGQTVLHIATEPAELARDLKRPESEIMVDLAEGRRRMLAYREKRVPPLRDEKILTAWNGLMISAFARAGRILRHAPYTDAARKAADFILRRMTDQQGGLLRRFKDDQAEIPGYVEDYAFFAAALFEVYQATFDERYLQAAIRYVRDAVNRFYDGAGSFYLTQADGEPLIHRPKDVADAGTASGTGVMVQNLLRLLPFTGNDSLRTVAEQVLKAHGPQMEQYPSSTGSLLLGLDLYLAGPTEVTLLGDTPEEWLERLGRKYLPHLVLTRIAEPRETAPIWAGKSPIEGRPTAYVCRNFVCAPPAADWASVELHLND